MVTNQTHWVPLLKGREAEDALSRVKDIEACLIDSLWAGERLHDVRCSSPFLGDGAAGIALFFAYLEAAGLSSNAPAALSRCLDIELDAVRSQLLSPSFYFGFSGIAWVIEHLDALANEMGDDGDSDVDQAISLYVNRSPCEGDYDLLNGLAGLGVYSLGRRSPAAQHAGEMIVERLYEMAEHSESGACWFHHPGLFVSDKQRTEYPNGYYNLGVAHGTVGVMAVLGKIYAGGIKHRKIRELFEASARWLLQQRLPGGSNSWFAGLIKPGEQPRECRLAWCHGDAGISAALLLAARCFNSIEFEKAAICIGRDAARRDHATSGVEDACFCHGSSGLAHIFNRLYQATRDDLFADSARYWLGRTLQMQKPGTGAAGYSMWSPNDEGKNVLVGPLGVLEGIAGIGLTLLAAITSIEPSWDKMFLTDIPVQQLNRNA
jgi:lantibiotic modifying enzyme